MNNKMLKKAVSALLAVVAVSSVAISASAYDINKYDLNSDGILMYGMSPTCKTPLQTAILLTAKQTLTVRAL